MSSLERVASRSSRLSPVHLAILRARISSLRWRRAAAWRRRTREPGPAPPPDDRANPLGPLARRHKRRGPAGARAEVSDLRLSRGGHAREPVRGRDQTPGEKCDVETQLRRLQIDGFL